MITKKIISKKNKEKVKINNDFNDNKIPYFKIILKNSWPSLLLMFFTGLYGFFDDIFSINFASDSYDYIYTNYGFLYESTQMVRAALSICISMMLFLEGLALLIAIGSSVKYSYLLSINKDEEAKAFLSTSFKFNIIVSLISIPLLLLMVKPWISFQYHVDPYIKNRITKLTYEYLWIIIVAQPLLMFNQYMSSIFRALKYNKLALLIMGLPLFLNLFLDYIFMDKINLGIEGGAYATMLSYAVSSIAFSVIIIFFLKHKHLNFRNLFNLEYFSFKWVWILLLIGTAPFFRNIAQTVKETIEMHNVQEISPFIYANDPSILSFLLTNALPLFNIFFPVMFGFIHGLAPVVSRYSSKKEFNKKKFVLYLSIVAFSLGIILTIFSFLISDSLFGIMKISNSDNYSLTKTKNILVIMMFSLPFYGILISFITVLTGLSNYLVATFASILRGLILVVPIVLLFKFFATSSSATLDANGVTTDFRSLITNNGIFSKEFIFWWEYPTLTFLSSMIMIPIYILSIKFHEKNEQKKMKLQKI